MLNHTTTARIVNFICVVVAPMEGRHCLGSLPDQSCLCIFCLQARLARDAGDDDTSIVIKSTPLSQVVVVNPASVFYASLIHIV